MVRIKVSKPAIIPPTHQANASLDQAAPAQNTWYTILDTTRNCRLIACLFAVAVANEDLECRVTIDGQTYTATQANAVAGTPYYLTGWYYGAVMHHSTNVPSQYGAPFIMEGRSIKVEVRKTSANGAGNLSGTACYAKW